MKRWLAAVLLAVCPLAVAQAAGPKAVSINMCTDQLLLALADDDQILGLSPYARDPSMSWHAARATGFPRLSGLAEDVLPLKPALVLTATFVKPETRAMLSRAGLRIEEFDSANSIDEVRQQIRRAGTLLAQPDRAEAAIRRIDLAQEQMRSVTAVSPMRVLPLARRGWVSGGRSLTTDMLEQSGLINLGGEATGAIGGRLALETIVALKPDRLLVTDRPDHADDQGTAFLRHPALERTAPATGRLAIPQAMTVCAGPMLADALERMAAELRQKAPAPR